MLGTGVPQTASFFLLYVVFNALVVKPLALLRLLGLVIYLLRCGAAKPFLWFGL